MMVSFDLENVTSHKKMSHLEAFTTKNVTGTLKPVEWNQYNQRWSHLREVDFPSNSRPNKQITFIDRSRLL